MALQETYPPQVSFPRHDVSPVEDSVVLGVLQWTHTISERLDWIDDGILHKYSYPGNYKGVDIVIHISGTRNNFIVSFGPGADNNGFDQSEAGTVVPAQFWYEDNRLHNVETMVNGNAVVSCVVQEENGAQRRNAVGYVTKYAPFSDIHEVTQPHTYTLAPEVNVMANAQQVLHILDISLSRE